MVLWFSYGFPMVFHVPNRQLWQSQAVQVAVIFHLRLVAAVAVQVLVVDLVLVHRAPVQGAGHGAGTGDLTWMATWIQFGAPGR